MLEFLVSLLIFLLSLNSNAAQGLEDALDKLEQSFPAVENAPAVENPLDNRLSHQPQDNNTEGVNQEQESTNNSENQASGSNNSNNNSSNSETPDTNKSKAFNTQSGNVIGSVANVAIEESPVLEPNSESQEDPDSSPTPTPTVVEPTQSIDPPKPTPPICIQESRIICPQSICIENTPEEGRITDPCGCSCLPFL